MAAPGHRGIVMNPRAAVWVVNGLLAGLVAVSVFPLLWMASVSFMQPGASSALPTPILPVSVTLENYRLLFGRIGMGRYLFNSLLISVLATTISVALNVMAGYAFAKLRFRGREAVFKGLLGALVIPGQVAMLPLFLMLKPMGLINSYAGAIVPLMASVFGIFLVRQFARGIPEDLLEAARIDGAGELRIFATIIVPALKPVIATLAVFSFLGAWNDFMWPLIVLTDDSLHTLPVALAGLSREHVQDNEMMMAGSVVTVLPVLVLFLALQRQYMAGLMAGSVKG
jgi:multiple sugar transport system permease protein